MQSGMNKILYVEDDPDIAFLVGRVLRKTGGFEVRHCICGADAIDAIEDFNPDLVLLDVMMPKMDGPETLRRLRKTKTGADVPAVFMTARIQNHDVEAYLRQGAVGVLPKPIDSNTVCDTLRAFWQSDRMSRDFRAEQGDWG
jgi:two-component system, OmpR family, response regulator